MISSKDTARTKAEISENSGTTFAPIISIDRVLLGTLNSIVVEDELLDICLNAMLCSPDLIV